MKLMRCPSCRKSLRIEENDYMEGCREMEEVYCPSCYKLVTKVFTSGIPTASVVEEDKNEKPLLFKRI